MPSLDDLARGIDVSHHRGDIEWHQVKQSGVTFGIVKCTDGTSFIDGKFDTNWTRMRRAGVIRGAYHFFRPGDDPKKQANHYLRMVGDILDESDLPPVLDFEAYPLSVREAFESLSLEERFRRANIWLDTVEVETGRLPIVYTNLSTWRYFMGDTTKFNHHPLWIANYDVETPNLPASNWGGKSWTIWQMTDRASVPGVNDGEPPVDLNVYKDTPEGMMSWLGITTQRTLPPVATNQEILESLVRAAHLTSSDPDLFIQKAGLAYLGNPVENLLRPYDGPALQDLPLTEVEKTAVTVAFDDISQGLEPTLVEATNQDVINAFYAIAGQFDIAGWGLIELAKLEYMIYDRSSFYTGPAVADLPGLTNEQKAALAVELGVPVPEGAEPDPPPEEPLVEEPPLEQEPILTDPVLETPAEPIDEPVVDEETPLDIPYPGISNQDMVNAFYQVGKRLEYAGWGLVERAELTGLAENREADYSGPYIAELDGLNVNIQAQLREILEDGLDDLQLSLPYPGLLNQDIINMFYRAASKMGEDGWVWILIVGLEYMTETRPLRYEPYRGPLFEKYQGLNVEQLTVLQEELAALLNN